MEANELRIGNWVGHENKAIQVHELPFLIDTDESVDGYLINERWLTEHEPIPLTEEWLLKLGFEFSHHGEISNDNFIIEKYHDGYHYTGGEGVAFGTPIVYVHQLQNLYFALTGEELKTQ